MDISTNYANGDKTNTAFEPISFETTEQLKEIVKKDWTPAVTIGGRTLDHFAYSQFLFGDIDNDSREVDLHCTIEEFGRLFSELEYYIITSRNHNKNKSKQSGGEKWVSPATDRYHVLFPLTEDCYDAGWISRQLDGLCERHNFFDKSAKGATRFYFGCDSEVTYHKGNRWIYEPETVQQKDAEYVPETNSDLDATLNQRILERLKDAYDKGVFVSYGEWIKVGQALKASGFTIEEFKLVTDDNVSEITINNKWNSFKSTKVTKGTLIEYARMADPNFLTKGSVNGNGKSSGKVFSSGGSGNNGGTVPPNTVGGNVPSQDPPKYLDFYERMDVNDFPDFSQARKVTPTSNNTMIWIKTARPTLHNLEVMLDKYGIKLRYNLMSHMPELEANGIVGEGNIQNAVNGIIVSLCKLNGLDLLGNLQEMIHVLTNKNKYHPVKEWINEGGEKWDGIDRFKELCSAIVLNDFKQEYFELYMRKWLISAYACLFYEDYRGRGVLTFQGKQYQGKSAFFKVLMKRGCERKWFNEGLTLDPKNKDSVALAIGHWISELGELEGTFKRSDISSLKAFLTKDTDVIRMPYDKREETYARRSVFCASVNDSLFLADDTGSSRFWVVPVSFIHLDRLKEFNSKQLWLQVREWFRSGEQWWMTQEEDEQLQKINESFTERDPYEDKINSLYHVEERNLTPDNLRFMTVSEISEEMGIKVISKSISNGVARALRKMGFQFKKTTHVSGYLMPRTYSASERDAQSVEHIFKDYPVGSVDSNPNGLY